MSHGCLLPKKTQVITAPHLPTDAWERGNLTAEGQAGMKTRRHGSTKEEYLLPFFQSAHRLVAVVDSNESS